MQNQSAATSEGVWGGGRPPVTNTAYKLNQNRSAASSQGGLDGSALQSLTQATSSSKTGGGSGLQRPPVTYAPIERGE